MDELFALGEQVDQETMPDGLIVRDESARREDQLARLTQTKAVRAARPGADGDRASGK